MAAEQAQSAGPTTSPPPDVAANLLAVRAHIDECAAAAGREGKDVTLVAVTKTHPPEIIRLALDAGHEIYGENRVQEAEGKWPALKQAYESARLHLIGLLQTNKIRHAVALFDVIESVDRPKLARKLADEMARTGRRPDCYVQVNTGEEPQKGGVLPGEADGLIAACRDDYELPLRGLMCIPPLDEEPSLHFALLAKIAERNGLGVLSMGMSADYEIAIAFGATHVRVGTAIFGPRNVL
jgi:pyridoxal phosphate enzyme (YggS family)